MSGCSGGPTAPMQQQEPPAPWDVAAFVAKTYRMVDDPSTDAVIAWGPASNSFVVADPFAFGRTLLPAYFKHRNFSSFVRQLNTYGFRKVDPDRWEFAHVSFLHGQTQLLHRVVRQRRGGKRKHGHGAGAGAGAGAGGGAGGGSGSVVVDDDEEGAATAATLAMEVARLRREHKANEELLAAMWRRVQEIERRPKRMLALFLAKAAGDPQALRRALVAGTGGGGSDGVGGKRDSAETEDTGPVKSARLLPDSDRAELGSSGGDGDGDEAAGRRTDGILGGGEDDFDFTRFLTGGGREGGVPDATLHVPCGQRLLAPVLTVSSP